MKKIGHKMGVILWNHIFKTVLGYFLLVSKNDKIVSDFKLFTYRWKTFGFELLHSLEHILLDATSWGLGINVGIMPWDSASSVPPLLHLDPLLHPGLNNPAYLSTSHRSLNSACTPKAIPLPKSLGFCC